MALPNTAANRVAFLRKAMDEDGQQKRPLWCVVDGGYTNRTFIIKHLPPRTVAVGRIRADAKLYHLPESTEGMPGRNRVYGERAQTPEQVRQDTSIPWQRVRILSSSMGMIARDFLMQPAAARWLLTFSFLMASWIAASCGVSQAPHLAGRTAWHS